MICAEPLTHVAYGPCGHRDACVECVARLRFVMDDERCVICQQPCPSMFATRAMGEYTETIGADAFAELPVRARSRRVALAMRAVYDPTVLVIERPQVRSSKTYCPANA